MLYSDYIPVLERKRKNCTIMNQCLISKTRKFGFSWENQNFWLSTSSQLSLFKHLNFLNVAQTLNFKSQLLSIRIALLIYALLFPGKRDGSWEGEDPTEPQLQTSHGRRSWRDRVLNNNTEENKLIKIVRIKNFTLYSTSLSINLLDLIHTQ